MDIKNEGLFMNRAIVLDGLKALFLMQLNFDRLLKENSYACGYREGYTEALHTVAQMIGVAKEFQDVQSQLKLVQPESFPVFGKTQEV